ncbi:MAG: hypothetical protein LW704_09910 [Cryomorphaceae bacterium]|nr:hypothetical protein [Cryomorphaceae bacterium]
MKYIQIQTPCSEDWNAMKPNEKGAFCQSCAKNVLDLTRMSTTKIHAVLQQHQNQSICTRIQNTQLDSLNLEFERWSKGTRFHMQRAMVASLLIVFGLTLFSCTNKQQEEQIRITQKKMTEVVQQQQNETAEKEFEWVNIPIIQELEEVTMGEMEMPQEVIQEIEAIENEKHALNYTMMGDIAMLPAYYEYTQQIQPVIELDANGNPIPKYFSALAYPNPAVESSTLKLGIPTAIDANTPGIYLVIIQSKEFKETARVVKL